ncbi:MAG: Peptidase sortase-like protein [Parcubacteria group bacterium]|nr:Peptidase sortase-like protein [Parcubacteria group bacterium]
MANNGPATIAAVRGIRAGQKALTKKWSFMAVFALVFLSSFGSLAALDLLPDASKAEAAKPATTTLTASAVEAAPTPELPTKIEIPAIKLSVTVSNPTSTDAQVLDNALLTGAVRYPSSSELGEQGNVIIFGHSSYLPIVNNPAYKTFDGIQNLKTGDRITVTGSGHTYVYSVQSVQKENTATGAIPLTVSGSVLTLATCNSFETTSDRFVVTANLVESDPLGA